MAQRLAIAHSGVSLIVIGSRKSTLVRKSIYSSILRPTSWIGQSAFLMTDTSRIASKMFGRCLGFSRSIEA